MALLYGIRWCINNEYEFILAESDSKLLVNCVNGQNSTPWKMQKEVEELKAYMENAERPTRLLTNWHRYAILINRALCLQLLLSFLEELRGL
ncbi:hypothetical protein H5410_031109 [Solanum commersonii]|uniref:RNase H type-1 domain-containing protein n=1 Tax=Solanum commersonii TaxID=4109 RepID=A0A9J5YG83_SOLCO|nr:hypothetical protein H5410_031109 [Solanum commersonii]